MDEWLVVLVVDAVRQLSLLRVVPDVSLRCLRLWVFHARRVCWEVGLGSSGDGMVALWMDGWLVGGLVALSSPLLPMLRGVSFKSTPRLAFALHKAMALQFFATVPALRLFALPRHRLCNADSLVCSSQSVCPPCALDG